MVPLLLYLLVPAVFYLACFAMLTYPSITQFSSHFLMDDGDGFVFVWNSWWARKAVFEDGQSPWFTDQLHHPFGISLAGHSLSPFNAFLGALLIPLLGVVQTMNLLLVSTFVVGGITAFWLCSYVTRSYWGSLIGGVVFTFSSYHFAHAQGHLNLTSLQWIPLFLLAWLHFLRRPSRWVAAGAAFALFLNALCDLYYLVFCVIAAAVMAGALAYRNRRRFISIVPRFLAPSAIFLLAAATSSGGFGAWVLLYARGDPFSGVAHQPDHFSTDLLAPMIPGAYSRWRGATDGYWRSLTGGGVETSVFLGCGVVALMVYAWWTRRSGGIGIGPWFLLASVFFVLSLGPFLQVWARGYRAPIVPVALLIAAWRYRTHLGAERLGVAFILLAAYAVFFQSQYTRIAPADFGLLVLAAGGCAFLWRMDRESHRTRVVGGLFAVLSISLVNADSTLHSAGAFLATALLAAGLLVYAWRRSLLSRAGLAAWSGLFGYVLLVGLSCELPRTHLTLDSLPYSVLEVLIPPLKMGGTPVRMMVMVTVCAGVICAFAVKRIAESGRAGQFVAVAALPLLMVELWPAGLNSTSPEAPRYVSILASLEGKEATLNLVDPLGRMMYYQTLYDKPQAFGYTSRIPRSLVKKERELRNIIVNRQFSRLYPTYRIRYLIAPPNTVSWPSGFRQLYRDERAELFDMGAKWP